MKNIRRFIVLICMGLGFEMLIKAKVPIIYNSNYDISLFGLERLHPFDAKKYGKVARYLQKVFKMDSNDLYDPKRMITDQELLRVHTDRYLESLRSSSVVAQIAGVSSLYYVPNFLLQRFLLNTVRYATAGTVLGAELALEYGWSINLGGGYHHAKTDAGDGFCFFADIPLAVKTVREKNPTLKVLTVDLDAHRGNGIAQELGNDPLTFIFDMYGDNLYPSDNELRHYIDFSYPLIDGIKDDQYLAILKKNLPCAIERVKPDLIIYNAGTDVFEKDPLATLRLTKQGIIERDLFVFSQAFKCKIPILMVLSGGYSSESWEIIGQSIENIIKSYHLGGY